MRQRYVFFIAASLLCSTQLSAQYSITGTVKTEKGAAIEMAYVSVLNGTDSSLVASGQTDEQGKYLYNNVPSGKYIIDVQALGYRQKKQPVLLTGNTEIETIVLNPIGNEMEEVVVTAQKNIISTELGKTVVHVRESMKAGNSLLDLLRNVPGVSIGADGSIS
ncbi:MAG: carboxypeptidase-like regulatory domain-containing protein, partial [Taibaiella sp.]|nr:carboxypeptidase-like regulatory domain-containing protein [Taibaiella sp.]